MRITKVTPETNYILSITTDEGKTGMFDLSPYLQYEAFEALKNLTEFSKVMSRGYYIEWECGADLSADTIEARLIIRST